MRHDYKEKALFFLTRKTEFPKLYIRLPEMFLISERKERQSDAPRHRAYKKALFFLTCKGTFFFDSKIFCYCKQPKSPSFTKIGKKV